MDPLPQRPLKIINLLQEPVGEIQVQRTGQMLFENRDRDHPVNEYLIPGRRRGCSPVKALGFVEHLTSYASLFAGEHEPVTTAILSGEGSPYHLKPLGTGTHFHDEPKIEY